MRSEPHIHNAWNLSGKTCAMNLMMLLCRSDTNTSPLTSPIVVRNSVSWTRSMICRSLCYPTQMWHATLPYSRHTTTSIIPLYFPLQWATSTINTSLMQFKKPYTAARSTFYTYQKWPLGSTSKLYWVPELAIFNVLHTNPINRKFLWRTPLTSKVWPLEPSVLSYDRSMSNSFGKFWIISLGI